VALGRTLADGRALAGAVRDAGVGVVTEGIRAPESEPPSVT
jgi:hypothetical protein